jgi:hypothetical protein
MVWQMRDRPHCITSLEVDGANVLAFHPSEQRLYLGTRDGRILACEPIGPTTRAD